MYQFPENRYKHCHNVGLRMKCYAEFLHWSQQKCNDMFVLGCMHDIGYELDPDPFKHDEAICRSLHGYLYSKEILHHSYYQSEFDTPEMRLLYFGDSTVDGYGNWCTFDERLADIANRHGVDSRVFKETKEIIDKLIEWGFNDKVGLKEV